MKKDKARLWPLTSVQREIWFDQILHPDVPMYNIGGYVRIDGPADPVVFEKALNRVVSENHHAGRSAYAGAGRAHEALNTG